MCAVTSQDHSPVWLSTEWASPHDNKLAALSDSTISDYNLWHAQLQQTQVSQTERKKGIGTFWGTYFSISTTAEPIFLVIIKCR